MEHASLLKYKFAFAIDNTFDRGYFSEKVLNAVRAHAVPIVAGWRGGAREDAFFAHHANPRRVIYCEFGGNASDPTRTLPPPHFSEKAP